MSEPHLDKERAALIREKLALLQEVVNEAQDAGLTVEVETLPIYQTGKRAKSQFVAKIERRAAPVAL